MADKIAFLGLGSMGAAMAANLLKAGFPLTVYNRTAEKAEPLRQQGATVAQRALPHEDPEESQADDQRDFADTLADAQDAAADTAAAPAPQSDQVATEPATSTEPIVQPTPLHIDSAKLIIKPTPLIMGSDSAVSPSPTP